MVFGPWQALAEASAHAPDAPGVLQARAEGLRAFPRGKSAMILYAASEVGQPLAGFVTGAGAAPLARAATLGATYVRFAPSPQPAEALARLLDRFFDRFGALPPANQNESSS